MIHLIDIRALQGAGRTGVEVYIEGFLYDLLVRRKVNEGAKVVLWGNAFGGVDLPDFIEKYCVLENVECVMTGIPNKVFNVFCSMLRWPKVDQLCGVRELLDGNDEVVFWVLDPRPAPVSDCIRKHVVVHDLSLLKFPRFFSWRTRLWSCFLRLRQELKEADIVYAVSQFTADEVLEWEPSFRGKVMVRYPTLPPRTLEVALDQVFLKKVRDKFELPQDRFLLSISTLEPRKNLELAVHTFLDSSFPEYDTFVIVGQQNLNIFRHVDLAEDSSVKVLGFISENEKWALYHLASGFICLSQYEGYGIPIKDAIDFDLPLILSDIPVFREIVGEYKDVTWVQI